MNKISFPVFSICFLIFMSCNVSEKLERHKKAQADANFIMNNLNDSDIINRFPKKHFPRHQIQPLLNSLTTNCDFASKKGKFVDFFSMNINGKNQTAYIYEYILNCDSLRFIYTYDLDVEDPELFSFRIEGLEEENKMIIDPKKQLLHSGNK